MKILINDFMQYMTHYSVEDCMGLMMRKNIYDVFEYIYEKLADNALEITITGCNTHAHKNIRTCYHICFEKREKTIVSITFLNEFYILPIPAIPKKWMDEFMKQKLSAEKYNE